MLASKYRLDEELGRGGMGAVYRAMHLLVRKEFAVKVLNAELAQNSRTTKRFLLEAQAAGRIGHPGILEVYDVGEDNEGQPFLVMELLRGEPLSSWMRRTRVRPDTAAWIAIEVLDILAAAHEAGVIHRDVKPQNVFLVRTPSGPPRVKLLDFGIAKFREHDGGTVTRSGEIIGSPLYMAPEQARGESDIDGRADVWSVGAMLYEMLTGGAAHAASTPVAVLAKILTQPAPPPSSCGRAIPLGIDETTTRALAIDREARFESAAAMAEALRAARASEGREGPPVLDLSEATAPSRAGQDEVDPSASTSSAVARPFGEDGPPRADARARAETTARSPRARRITVGLAVVALASLGIAPLLVPSWRGGATRGSEPPPAAASVAPAASLSADVPSREPVVAVATATAAPFASAPSVPSAAGSPRRPSPARPKASASAPSMVSDPECAAGEVLSSGHCCPRGLVWQAGRCERPLATSF